MLSLTLVLLGAPAVDTPALDACLGDRRCRIERLRQRNAQRRRTSFLEPELEYQRSQDLELQREKRQQPRKHLKWHIDWTPSRLGALGFAVGYTLATHVKFQVGAGRNSDNIFGRSPTFLEGHQQLTWARTAATFLPLDGRVSPYFATGFMVATGSLDPFYTGPPLFSEPGGPEEPLPVARAEQSTLSTRYHAVELSLGIDMQLFPGIHAALGLAFRHLIYNQASYEPGEYDEGWQLELQRWFRDAARFDVQMQIGWAL